MNYIAMTTQLLPCLLNFHYTMSALLRLITHTVRVFKSSSLVLEEGGGDTYQYYTILYHILTLSNKSGTAYMIHLLLLDYCQSLIHGYHRHFSWHLGICFILYFCSGFIHLSDYALTRLCSRFIKFRNAIFFYLISLLLYYFSNQSKCFVAIKNFPVSKNKIIIYLILL